MLSWIFIVPTHWNNSPWIDMSPHSATLFWFLICSFTLMLRAYQRCNKSKLYSLWIDMIGAQTTHGEPDYHYTTNAVVKVLKVTIYTNNLTSQTTISATIITDMLLYINMPKAYVSFLVITIWSLPHSLHITGFVTRVTRRVLLVEQELLSLREHLISKTEPPPTPIFSGVRVVLTLMFCPFVLFSLAIVFSVLRITASDYSFGIFKFFYRYNAIFVIIMQYKWHVDIEFDVINYPIKFFSAQKMLNILNYISVLIILVVYCCIWRKTGNV